MSKLFAERTTHAAMSSKYSHYLVLFMMFCIPHMLWYVHNHPSGFRIDQFVSANALSALPYFSLSLLMLSALPGVVATVVVTLLALVLVALSSLGAAHAIIYGNVINGGSVYILLNSNLSEAAEFLSLYVNFKVAALFLLIGATELFLVFTLFKSRKKYAQYRKQGFVLLLVLMPLSFIAATGDVHADTRDDFVRVYGDAFWNYKLDEMRMEKLRGETETEAINIVRRAAIGADDPETYVLVIGESISRNHMGLYGYRRNTNPLLGTLSDGIVKFEDVISAERNTIGSLQKMLTFANNQDLSALYQPNLLHIMKAAGFKVYWISNQKAFGSTEPWSKYLSEAADLRLFTNTGSFHDSNDYDEKLLSPFANIVKDGKTRKKFIIVHLMGAHQIAKNRYPASFDYFTDESNREWIKRNKRAAKTYQYINWYDNAVRHDDFILHSLMKTLESGAGIRMMLYLSDHGEEVGEVDDSIGRGSAATRYMYEIPFLVWMSPEYMAGRPGLYEKAKSAVRRPYQTDDLIHTFSDLSGIWTDRFVPSRSVVNDAFRPGKRVMGEIPYSPARGDRELPVSTGKDSEPATAQKKR